PGAAGGASIARQSSVGSPEAGVEVPRLASAPPASAPGSATSATPGAGGSPTGGAPRFPGPASLEPGGGLANAPRPRWPLPAHGVAPSGAGGPAVPPGPAVAIPSRLARPESEMVHPATPRLILEKSGGEPTIDAHVRDTAVEGLKHRDTESRGEVARS